MRTGWEEEDYFINFHTARAEPGGSLGLGGTALASDLKYFIGLARYLGSRASNRQSFGLRFSLYYSTAQGGGVARESYVQSRVDGSGGQAAKFIARLY